MYLFNKKPLLNLGKPAIHEDCCCGEGEPLSCECGDIIISFTGIGDSGWCEDCEELNRQFTLPLFESNETQCVWQKNIAVCGYPAWASFINAQLYFDWVEMKAKLSISIQIVEGGAGWHSNWVDIQGATCNYRFDPLPFDRSNYEMCDWSDSFAHHVGWSKNQL